MCLPVVNQKNHTEQTDFLKREIYLTHFKNLMYFVTEREYFPHLDPAGTD